MGHLRRASCPGLSDPAAERRKKRLSQQSVDVLGGIDVLGGDDMKDVPIMDMSKTAPNPSR